MLATPGDAKNLDKVLKLIGKTPEEIKLDIDYASIKDEPRRSREGGRGGDRGRPSPRDRDRRPRPIPVHGETASMEPFDPAAEVIPPAPRAERPERAERSEPRSERPARSRGRRGGSERPRNR